MSLSQKLESLGSSPRSSPGIYKKASSLFSSAAKAATQKVQSSPDSLSSLFSAKPSVSRLMKAPVETVTGAIADANAPPSFVKSSGVSFFRYLIILGILGFLGLNLLLFLIKPTDKDITHLYDPLIDIINAQFKGGAEKPVGDKKKKATPAIKKLEKIIDAKPVINKIDKDTPTAPPPPAAKETKKYNKLPVIPEADDSTSTVQKPASKSGFCYIGEDRGFRSCIEVGEGEVCMSGDIFPTQAICINPNLRE
jgi:hypothetical protein